MRPRVRRRGSLRLTAALGALAVLGGLVLPQRVSGQGELFERGNLLYQEEDFRGAIEAYEAVLSSGFESAALHYNLGNAHFRAGELGRAILEWERALVLAPGDPDALANLALARSLTADTVDPLPRFWLLEVVSWWIDLVPRGLLLAIVGAAWLALAGVAVLRILARGEDARRWGERLAIASGLVVLVLGANLLIREAGLGRAERGVILAEVVPARSAPAEEDDLTLFEVHEGTRVRIDQRAGDWAEIVLDDGKVGWVPVDALEGI